MQIQRDFHQMGLLPPGQLPNPQLAMPRLPSPPSIEELIMRRRIANEQPKAIDRHGPLAQFFYGVGSPVLGTLSKLGVVEKRPRPQGTLETIANVAGGILGWGLLFKAAPIAAVAGKIAAPIAGVAKTAAAKTAITNVASSAIIGGAFGVHNAWVEDEPLLPETLKSIAWGAGFGVLGLGLSKAMNKMGAMKKGTAQVLTENMTQRKPILSLTDDRTVPLAGRLGSILEKAPEKRVAPAVDRIIQKLRLRTDPLPSSFKPGDAGLRAGSAFDMKSPREKARIVLKAFQDDPDRDTLFQPLLDVAKATQATGSIFRLKGKPGMAASRVRAIARVSEATPLDLDGKVMQSLTKRQKELMGAMTQGKNLGNQVESFDHLRRLVHRTQHSTLKRYEVGKFAELIKVAPENVVQKFSDRHSLMQDINWQLGRRISKVVSADPSVNLPSLEAVQDAATAQRYLESLKQDFKKGVDLDSAVQWHPRIKEFLSTWNGITGKSYRDTTYMPPKMRKEFDELVKSIRAAGDHTRLLHHDLNSFPVPAELAKKDIPKFIADAVELPKGSLYLPQNLQETMTLQRQLMPVLGRFLTPVRYALGDSFSSAARSRVQMHQKFMNGHRVKIKNWFKELGLKPGKKATEAATRMGAALEGKVPDAVSNRFTVAGTRLAGYKVAPTGRALQNLTRDTGLPAADIKKVFRTIDAIKKDPERFAAFEKYAKTTGVTIEKYATQHLLTQKLYRAGSLTGARADKVAQDFGLNNAKELKVTFQLRREMDKLYRQAGLDPDLYLPGYLPRFREMQGEPYSAIVASFKDRGVPEKQIKGYLWMNEMSRQAEGMGYRYEQDAFRAFSRYVTGYSKSKHFGDDFFDPWLKHFTEQGVHSSRLKLMKDLRHWMVGRPGEAEQEMDALVNRFVGTLNKSKWDKAWGAKPTAEMGSLLAELQYMGGIGYNPFTAAKNLTQKGLALSSITDDGNPLHGLKWMMKARAAKKTPYGKFALSNAKILDGRQFQEGLEEQHGAITRLLYNLGLPDPIVKASKEFREKAFWMFRRSDISNVEDTFLAKFLYLSEKKGAPLADAVNMATQTAMATQFMYGFDSPMLYKSPLGRQIGIFMSWPINWAHLMYTQGTSGDIHRAVASVAVMAVGAEVLNLTGMNFRSISPINTARGILPLAMLEGEDSWPLALRAGAAITQQIRSLAAGDPVAIDASFDNLKRRLTPMVPAGIIGQRVFNFIDVAKNDWRRYDRRDRLRHETTPGEAVRSLFGPTIEAAQRVEEWQRVSKMDSYYRSMREQAIESYVDGDFSRFQRLQEQLLINFGKWIEPKDIRYEMQLREMSARERQLIGLPAELRESFLGR